MAEGISLPKPQPIIIPSFMVGNGGVIGNANNHNFPPALIDLSPLLPVPVSYQWQLTSLYMPLLALVEVITKAEAEDVGVTGTIQVTARLLRDGQVVWVSEVERGLPLVRFFGTEVDFLTKVLFAEDFNNPIVISPASKLQLEIEGALMMELPEGKLLKELKEARIFSGPGEGAPPFGVTWPGQGIIHYSLYDA